MRKNITIRSTKCAEAYLRRVMRFEQEEFWTMAFTSHQTLIEAKMIFLGTVDSCEIHPREIFRFAILTGASKILIAHTHPSGDTTPSIEDIKATNRLMNASQFLGIPIVDHLILTKKGFCSFQAMKLLKDFT